MNSAPRFLSAVLALVALAAPGCSPNMVMADASDAAVDAHDGGPPRNDRINVNCVRSDGAEENAADCNARLMTLEHGATFFVGSPECFMDPNSAACMQLCN